MKHPGIEWIRRRIFKQNKNVIIIINGATGAGKTFCALSLGCTLSQEFGTNFNVNDNLDFKFANFIKKTTLPQNQMKGTCFIFEEVGAAGGGASSREWQSKANLLFNSFLQTIRHRNQILIMTTPYFSFLDVASRKLVHIQIDMQYINFQTKQSVGKPYFMQVNSRTGKMYFKLLRYRVDDKITKLSGWVFPHPPKEITIEYEKLKCEYTTDLANMITEDKKAKVKKDMSIVDNDVIKALMSQNKYTQEEMADKLKISLRTLQRHIYAIRNEKFPEIEK